MAVQRIEGDDGAGRDAEFGKQRLRCRDFVGFLGDLNMGEHEGGVGGERAQHLGGGAVVKVVETAAERLVYNLRLHLTDSVGGLLRWKCLF